MMRLVIAITAFVGSWILLAWGAYFAKIGTHISFGGHSVSQMTLLLVCSGLVGVVAFHRSR